MADRDAEQIRRLIEPLRVKPGRKVDLPGDFDPGDTADFVRRKDADEILKRSVELLADYQERLAAQDTYGLLVVLQAIDAAGKDGTIRHVMSGVNPQGVQVTSFKAPSATELDHDYLWRAAAKLPPRGMIGIFNRSYYEEVLVVRVHPEFLDGQRLPSASTGKDIWTRRYREINDWERYLVDNGIRIVKLFLNVSKEEQAKRFIDRIEQPNSNWKFSPDDLRERERWDDYRRAFAEMLSNTSTKWAPWYVIPADHKWFMRIAASAAILDALVDIDPQYPVPSDEERAAMLAAKEALRAES
jgi:PPK2 family polyphosphate:nucleotide phosphotransferase